MNSHINQFNRNTQAIIMDILKKKKNKNRNGNLICLNKQLNKMLRSQPIVLAQVKAGNTLGNVLTRQIVCSLNKAEKITKKVKLLAPTWAKKLILSDGSYFVPDIQDYFEYVIKIHGKTV